MDRVDIALSQHLQLNSRTPYRELANKFGLSVNAVHKRIQALQEANVIRAFTARVSLYYLRTTIAMVFGHCSEPVTEEVVSRLGKNESVYWVALGGGNYVYVGAYLRSLDSLGPVVEAVKKEARMPDPSVGLMTTYDGASKSEGILAPVDYRIIRSLAKSSRKPVTEVGRELGLSARTVQRRLDKMVKEGLIDLSIDWYPDASDDIISMIHIGLKPPAEQARTIAALMKSYQPHALFCFVFGNLPNLVPFVVWTNSMRELQEVRRRLQAEDFVASVMLNVLYSGWTFDTWRDELVEGEAWAKR